MPDRLANVTIMYIEIQLKHILRAHGDNEMCNFYMYYYVDAKHANPFGESDPNCAYDSEPTLFKNYPAEASVPFEHKPELEHTGHQYTDKFCEFFTHMTC